MDRQCPIFGRVAPRFRVRPLSKGFIMSYDTNNNQQSRMVTGLFPDRASAERAYGSISDRGYGRDDVNLMMSDSTRKLVS
ncbi:MAG TPA: hypothetical protein DDZ22_13710 [Massilia sp.]|nr:hypothetical protein [Massilia sp.]